MTPAELLDDDIPVEENLSYMDRVIATDFVVGHTFILRGVLVFVEALAEHFPQWIEIFIIDPIILVLVCLIRGTRLKCVYEILQVAVRAQIIVNTLKLTSCPITLLLLALLLFLLLLANLGILSILLVLSCGSLGISRFGVK